MTITREESGFGPGAAEISAPRVPGLPYIVTHTSSSITFAIDDSGNDPVVTYALRMKTDTDLDGSYETTEYVQGDLTLGGSEVFKTKAAWGTLLISGLTVGYAYVFAAKAKNEAGTESAYSSDSHIMTPLPDLDPGIESAQTARGITGSDVIIDDVAGVTFDSTAPTAVEATNGETWYTGTVVFGFNLQSYIADETANIEGQFSEDGGSNYSAATLVGTTTGLETSVAGTPHTIGWDSLTDAGTSEYQTDVMFRLRAQDETGNWSPWVACEEFIVYNRPAVPVVLNSDNQEWAGDTTPAFEAIIPAPRGGTALYPEIYIYENTAGTPLVSGYPKIAIMDVTGWEYETGTPASYTPLTITGIPTGVADGARKVKYTVQTALPVAKYLVTMRFTEPRDWS